MADRVLLSLGFLVVWTTAAVATTTTTATPAVPTTEHEVIKCKYDWNCEEEEFCNHETSTCSKCMDCSEFHMDPGRTDCPKGRHDCEGCSKGFVIDEDSGHCRSGIPPSISIPTYETSTSSGGFDWRPLIVFLVLVAAALIVGGPLCLKYNRIRARQSVSSESPPERKSLITEHEQGQGGPFSSNGYNNGDCEQEPDSVAASAPPENILDHHFSASMSPISSNPTFLVENEMQTAKSFRPGRRPGEWVMNDDVHPVQNSTAHVDTPHQMVPENNVVAHQEDTDQHEQIPGEENVGVVVQQLTILDQIAEILNSPASDNRSTSTLPQRRRVPRTRSTRGHPYQLPNEETSDDISSAASTPPASRHRQASEPSGVRVPQTETTRDFSSAGPSTSDLTTGPSTSSMRGYIPQPPSQTQSAANTRVHTRNNSWNLSGESGYSSSAGFLEGGSMGNFVHMDLGLSGGPPFGSDRIPGQPPPQYHQPCSSLRIAKIEVSQFDINDFYPQDQVVQTADIYGAGLDRGGSAVGEAGAHAGGAKVPGIEPQMGELDNYNASVMDVDDLDLQRVD